MDGISLGLAAAVPFYSCLIKTAPPDNVAFTGKVYTMGDIGEVGGIEVKLEAVKINNMTLVVPTGNFSLAKGSRACHSITDLVKKYFP